MKHILTVAIQGDKASFHEIAAHHYYNNDPQLLYCQSFEEVFAHLVDGRADKAFVAVQNTAHGVILPVQKLLSSHNVEVEGQYELKIEQHLIGLPGAQPIEALTVMSHPVALSQCDRYLSELGVHEVAYYDTSAAAAFVKDRRDRSIMAIGSEAAAKLHGLAIVTRSIQNDPNNTTMFVSIRLTSRNSRDETRQPWYTKGMKPRIIFLHGNETTHWSQSWAGWLKTELEKAGYETFFETMPDSIFARAEYWLPFIEEYIQAGENDVIVGWSSGAVAAMRYAEDHTLAGSVLISPTYTDLGDEIESMSGYFDQPWQWEKIRTNQDNIALITGDNDPFIPQEEFDFIAQKLNPTRIKLPQGGHFIEQESFPRLLDYIKDRY